MAINHIKPGMSTDVKRILNDIAAIECIPPDNGEEYTGERAAYHVGDGEIIMLNERQRNLAVIIATEPKLSSIHTIVKAGYDVQANIAWDKNTPQKTITSSFKCKFNKLASPKVMTLKSHLQKNVCKALSIDANWLLGQQVSLYEEARRDGKLSTAARILYDISGHIKIDARATNKVEIETDVNYAGLLEAADKRIQGTVIDVTPDRPPLEDKSSPAPQEQSDERQ